MARAIQVDMDDDEIEDYFTEVYGNIKIGPDLEWGAGEIVRVMAETYFENVGQELAHFKCSECGEVHESEDDAINCCPDPEY